MKYRSGFWILFGLGCMGLLAVPTLATWPGLVGHFDCEGRVVAYESATGEATVAVELIPLLGYDRLCKTVSFEIIDTKGVQILSSTHWTLPFVDLTTPLVATVELIVPFGDTAGFAVKTTCGTWSWTWSHYFGPLGDSLKWYPSDPRDWPPLDKPLSEEEARKWRMEKWERGRAEWEQRQKDLDTIPPEGFHRSCIIIVNPADSALYDSLSDKGRQDLAAMRLSEREPLKKTAMQTWFIEGRVFQREHGEREFRPVQTRTEAEMLQQARAYSDSMALVMADEPRDIIVDLRNPDDSAFIRSLVDTLIPTDSAGYYRTTILFKHLRDLHDRHIDFRNADFLPRSPRNGQNRQPETPDSVEIGAQGSNREILFSDGFEGPFFFKWDADDFSAASGYDYWGSMLDSLAHTGFYSAWCAVHGDMPDGGPYDNNMNAYMRMWVPINMAGYSDRWLSFWVDLSTQPGVDFLTVDGSADCLNWVKIGHYDGYSYGWQHEELLLASNDSVCIQFYFYSNWENSNYYGAFLDDVEITADAPSPPNLTYRWPPFWSGPLVPSNLPGTT